MPFMGLLPGKGAQNDYSALGCTDAEIYVVAIALVLGDPDVRVEQESGDVESRMIFVGE